MKKINFKTQVLPHLIALPVFFLITVLLFHPLFFKNKSISQHDVLQGVGGGREMVEYRNTTGEEGLWTNSMFSGMPAYLINTHYNDTVLTLGHRVLSLGIPAPANIFMIACISFYILLVSFRVNPYLSIAGAIAFTFSSFNVIGVAAGHNSKILAVAYMPLFLAGIHLVFSKRYWSGFAITALGLALELKANHLQITYYLLLITLIYGAVELYQHLRQKELLDFSKKIAVLFLAALLGLGANMGRLWTVYEYGQYSIRGKSELPATDKGATKAGLDKAYAFQYSNGLLEPIVMFIPNFYGGSSQQPLGKDSHLGKALKKNGLSGIQLKEQLKAVPTYWGDQPMTAPYYSGAVAVFLFLMGIAFAEKKYRVWLLITFSIGIIFSWGKNFETLNYFLFDHLPGYNKFRSVTFAIIISHFSVCLLGFLGLKRFLEQYEDKGAQKKFFIVGGVGAGFALLTLLLAGMGSFEGAIDSRLAQLPGWFIEALREDRKSLLRADALRTLLFVLAASALLWFYLRKKLSLITLSILITLLIGIDQVVLNKRFLNSDSFKKHVNRSYFRANGADEFIKKDNQSHQRVLYLPNPFGESRTSYHHSSVGGYHGAKIRRYQNLIDRCIQTEQGHFIEGLRAGRADFQALNTLNMLNTGYIVTGNDAKSVLKNPSSNGNAWFVSTIDQVSSPVEELDKTCQVNHKTTAVIDTGKFPEIGTASTLSAQGDVRLLDKKPNYLKYQSNNTGKGLAVFSEIYYPKGWKATIDGKEVKILRANYVLRALDIPAGKHEIIFRFEPLSYQTGTRINAICGYLILLTLLGVAVCSLFFKKEEGNEERGQTSKQ